MIACNSKKTDNGSTDGPAQHQERSGALSLFLATVAPGVSLSGGTKITNSASSKPSLGETATRERPAT
jgi:hypothetical protein